MVAQTGKHAISGLEFFHGGGTGGHGIRRRTNEVAGESAEIRRQFVRSPKIQRRNSLRVVHSGSARGWSDGPCAGDPRLQRVNTVTPRSLTNTMRKVDTEIMPQR